MNIYEPTPYTSPRIDSIEIDYTSILCTSISGGIEDYEEDEYEW
jgi:hypothetical protein